MTQCKNLKIQDYMVKKKQHQTKKVIRTQILGPEHDPYTTKTLKHNRRKQTQLPHKPINSNGSRTMLLSQLVIQANKLSFYSS